MCFLEFSFMALCCHVFTDIFFSCWPDTFFAVAVLQSFSGGIQQVFGQHKALHKANKNKQTK